MLDNLTDKEEAMLSEVVQRLASRLHPTAIYLFGSQARGDAADDSDYDLLLVMPAPAPRPFMWEREAYRSLAGLAIPVDIIVMPLDYFHSRRFIQGSLAATVEREGMLLYAA